MRPSRHDEAGRIGGFLAGLGFMLPGLILILALAWAYRRLDLSQPLVAGALLGVQIGVVALIARAVHRISEHALTDRILWGTALAAALAAFLDVSFWITLAMTIGIFLPAFAFGTLFYDRLERVVDDKRLHHFLAGVAAGVVGLIATTTVQLAISVGRATPSPLVGALLFAAALAALYLWRSKLNVPAVILGSAAAGAAFIA